MGQLQLQSNQVLVFDLPIMACHKLTADDIQLPSRLKKSRAPASESSTIAPYVSPVCPLRMVLNKQAEMRPATMLRTVKRMGVSDPE